MAARNIRLEGADWNGVPAVNLPISGGGTARFTEVSDTTAVASDVASGKIFYDSSGTKRTGTSSGGKSTQVYNGSGSAKATSYTSTGVSITVAKSGTYDISWIGIRTTTSGTNGTQLYKGSSALGSAFTSFGLGSYAQLCQLSGQSLTAGDVLTVRARSRSTSYAMHAANLMIEEV